MNALIRHIEYLISRNDCVIIPGLGAVLAHYESAEYVPEDESFAPPRRAFSFNSGLSRSDGTLASSLARAEGIPYEAAAAKINQQAEALGRQLRIQGEVSLGRIGTLVLADDGITPLFQPFADDKLSVSTSWLPTVAKKAEAQQSEAPVFEYEPRRYSPFARFAKVAASIAILICVCFVASTPISVDEAAKASLSPEIRKAQTEQSISEAIAQEPEIDVWEADAQAYPAELFIYGSKEPIADEIAPAAENFLIIVGSFSTYEDAQRHIASTGNDHLRILEKSGRYRIYAFGFETEAEAYAKIAADPSLAGSWVCKK